MDAPVIIHSPTIFCGRLPLKLSKKQRTVTNADPVPEAPPDDPSQEEG